MKLHVLSSALMVLLFQGCAPAIYRITPSSSLNDHIFSSTKPSQKQNVQIVVHNPYQDGPIRPLNKDGSLIDERFQYEIEINTTLRQMVDSWASIKFQQNSDVSSSDIIGIQITHFSISEYCLDTESKQVMVGLAGGEVSYKLEANLAGLITIQKMDGTTYSKNVKVSSDAIYIFGVGTGTSTSHLYQGENSKEHKHAKNINDAMNKFVSILNSTVESNGY